VKDKDFGRTDIDKLYIKSNENRTIINKSTVINNTRVDKIRNVTYHAGPDKTLVEKQTGKTITPVVIKESKKPEQTLNKII